MNYLIGAGISIIIIGIIEFIKSRIATRNEKLYWRKSIKQDEIDRLATNE